MQVPWSARSTTALELCEKRAAMSGKHASMHGSGCGDGVKQQHCGAAKAFSFEAVGLPKAYQPRAQTPGTGRVGCKDVLELSSSVCSRTLQHEVQVHPAKPKQGIFLDGHARLGCDRQLQYGQRAESASYVQ